MGFTRWEKLRAEFRSYHKHHVNIALHLITTPGAIFAAAAILAQLAGAPAVWFLAIAWTLALALTTPIRLWLATALTMSLLSVAAVAAHAISVHRLAGLFVACYFGQDLAHWVTGEPTFQASYLGKRPGWVWTFLDHTHHLVPLCIDALFHGPGIAPCFVQRRQVVRGSLVAHPELMAALRSVGRWAVAQRPPKRKTTHWWWYDLSAEASAAFRKVALSPQVTDMFAALFPPASHVVEPLEGMNELYVAAAHQSLSSDNVFYMNHVDGPFGVFPLVHVYRCMCACTANEEVETIWPMEGPDSRATLSTGELAGFDFHRELHRIAPVPAARGGRPSAQPLRQPRVCLKLHYCVYPRCLAPYGKLLGWLTCKYNQTFRQVFLSTIAPDSRLARLNAWLVLGGTFAFNHFEAAVGWGNVSVLLAMLGASWLCADYRVFFYATSFTHYAIYMATYAHRLPCPTPVAFGAFKRDALLFKSLALIQATWQYAALPPTALRNQPHLIWQPHLPSLALLAAGFGLAALAAAALGVNRTYFGWELGMIEGRHVRRFPYDTIPHPMIVGGMLGWLGFHALPAFRAAHPYYAPLHVACYAAHALQEHASIHANGRLANAGGEADKRRTPSPARRPPKSPKRARSPAKPRRVSA